eukprot:CAMPEP_0172368786 /NCGR_PEP_ID=MMETSP1060-20121228/29420_1 /TAXON_ID=37318 /ORGANISM="Pseudo-nitzschia pungens, Strain cf. cingulata" /LENGTH=152 /DNA_ID=CAMNT_0013093509 /DNA_START=102 /DNA_END=557 /DNA_ORIENTATION=+
MVQERIPMRSYGDAPATPTLGNWQSNPIQSNPMHTCVPTLMILEKRANDRVVTSLQGCTRRSPSVRPSMAFEPSVHLRETGNRFLVCCPAHDVLYPNDACLVWLGLVCAGRSLCLPRALPLRCLDKKAKSATEDVCSFYVAESARFERKEWK